MLGKLIHETSQYHETNQHDKAKLLMALAYIGVGSTIEPQKYIQYAFDTLNDSCYSARMANVYKSGDVTGISDVWFYNTVIEVETDITCMALYAWLKSIEEQCGRCRDKTAKESGHHLDLDLLLFDDLMRDKPPILPRRDVYTHAFVATPLAQLCPDKVVAGQGRIIDIARQLDASHLVRVDWSCRNCSSLAKSTGGMSGG